MLILQHIAYAHPNKDVLFDNINLSIRKHQKVALIGNNGLGKSTLLKLMAGQVQPLSGSVIGASNPYYIPQLTQSFNGYTVAQVLGVSDKILALDAILRGEVTEEHLLTLDDDWSVEERCQAAFDYWQLDHTILRKSVSALSGGQKTKVFLAGIMIQEPDLVLMDEPSNHLDRTARDMLYRYIATTTDTLIVVSHDRSLLQLPDTIYELGRHGVTLYGGNYDFYEEQKALATHAFHEALRDKEKALRKAKDTERESIERQQKLDARGKRKQEKSGLPTISMNTLRNHAEKSTSRMKDVHATKTGSIAKEVQDLRKEMPDRDKMKMGFDESLLHRGKILITAEHLNYRYDDRLLWNPALDFQILSGDRIAITGDNGSGKTTLVKLLMGLEVPASGRLECSGCSTVYVDQDYTLLEDVLTVFEQAIQFNTGLLPEHEVRSRLTHFLFTEPYWNKPCATLSGGEKMRLILCCLSLKSKAPDMIILDEPTNNLDMQNTEILTEAIRMYEGTLVVVSHDAYFLEQVEVKREVALT